MEINFGNSVTNCNVIFDSSENANYGFGNNSFWIHGKNWNGSVAFPYGANSVICNGSSRMNMGVIIPNTVITLDYTFLDCFRLNQNIQIPNSVTNMRSVFSGCSNLNQNIQIPNSVTNIYRAFISCSNLNQNIKIPNSVTNIGNVFRGCTNLNQNIQIPNSVINMEGAFYGCSNFNQNIQIPNSVRNISNTFAGCGSLNQNIQIPNTIVNISSVFEYCSSMRDVTLLPSSRSTSSWKSIIRSDSAKSINIWTDDATALNMMNAGFIQGNVQPTMEVIDNGYYNSEYNVYIYTNTVFN